MTRRLAAAAAFATALVLLTAPATVAAPPSGGIQAPSSNAELRAASDVAVQVSFSAGGEVTSVSLRLQSLRGAVDDSRLIENINQRSFSYTWSTFKTGMLDYNGEYRITAEATGTDGPIDPSPETAVVTRTFRLAIPPVAPTDVRATFSDETRTVALSWTGNPEPDLLGYMIQRAASGGAYQALDEVPADTTSYTDDVGDVESGDYSYRVVALREGAYDLEQWPADKPYTAVNSDPSRPVAATVTAPPTTTAGEQPSGATTSQPGEAGSTSTSQKPALAQAGKVDLSGFAAMLDSARNRPAPRVTPPDTGYTDTLPYGSAPATAAPTTRPPSRQDVVLAQDDAELGDGERFQSMAFLAGGLFAFVLMMHVVWLKGEVDRVPLPIDEPGDEPGDEPPGDEPTSGDLTDGHEGGPEAAADLVVAQGGGAISQPSTGAGTDTLRRQRHTTRSHQTPRKRSSQGARGTPHRLPSRPRGDRPEGRPAVRARR